MAWVGLDIVQQHGWQGLYRGFGTLIARVFPVNGINIQDDVVGTGARAMLML